MDQLDKQLAELRDDIYNGKPDITELNHKIGRNDLCYCGSGKKYKNCCMKKDEEKERFEEMAVQDETVSDKYFPVKKYLELSGYPVTRFDHFLLEILNITAGILYRYNKISSDKAEELVKSLYNYSKEHYIYCNAECKYECLSNPLRNISFKSLKDKGLIIEELPVQLQKENCINFFYIEFISIFASVLERKLCELTDKEAHDISENVYSAIIGFVADNCSEVCNNVCMVHSQKDAYCEFCKFGNKKLPCPKTGSISYDMIKASEEDMECQDE